MLAGVIIPAVTAMAWGAFQSSQRSSIHPPLFALSQFSPPFIHSPGPLFPNAVHVVDDIQVNVSDDDDGVGHGYTSDGGDGVSYNDDGEVGDDDDNGGCEVEPKCWCTCMPRLFAD